MLDFMGLFYIVFSFFKMLDLKGFPDSFKMYDPLAKQLPIYAWIYPFIETALGLMFLFRFEVNIALICTLIVLGITTIGVTKILLDKKYVHTNGREKHFVDHGGKNVFILHQNFFVPFVHTYFL